jgi:Flp pilus assembly pilin Flp
VLFVSYCKDSICFRQASQGKTGRNEYFLLAIFTGFAIIAGMETIESNLFDNPKNLARTGLTARRPRSLWASIALACFFVTADGVKKRWAQINADLKTGNGKHLRK